eukprot:gnl/Chilomastix_cuspidata/4941.p1 GENE.gnl/Chilomastix_cuspidata/4941~~gnl/Chilomastix_cuspidata/4941.p1  ORF type:complete len:780 (+),score=227.01 gnl/Chilomastix_cuspidata/4941:62-2401(+)
MLARAERGSLMLSKAGRSIETITRMHAGGAAKSVPRERSPRGSQISATTDIRALLETTARRSQSRGRELEIISVPRGKVKPNWTLVKPRLQSRQHVVEQHNLIHAAPSAQVEPGAQGRDAPNMAWIAKQIGQMRLGQSKPQTAPTAPTAAVSATPRRAAKKRKIARARSSLRTLGRRDDYARWIGRGTPPPSRSQSVMRWYRPGINTLDVEVPPTSFAPKEHVITLPFGKQTSRPEPPRAPERKEAAEPPRGPRVRPNAVFVSGRPAPPSPAMIRVCGAGHFRPLDTPGPGAYFTEEPEPPRARTPARQPRAPGRRQVTSRAASAEPRTRTQPRSRPRPEHAAERAESDLQFSVKMMRQLARVPSTLLTPAMSLTLPKALERVAEEAGADALDAFAPPRPGSGLTDHRTLKPAVRQQLSEQRAHPQGRAHATTQRVEIVPLARRELADPRPLERPRTPVQWARLPAGRFDGNRSRMSVSPSGAQALSTPTRRERARSRPAPGAPESRRAFRNNLVRSMLRNGERMDEEELGELADRMFGVSTRRAGNPTAFLAETKTLAGHRLDRQLRRDQPQFDAFFQAEADRGHHVLSSPAARQTTDEARFENRLMDLDYNKVYAQTHSVLPLAASFPRSPMSASEIRERKARDYPDRRYHVEPSERYLRPHTPVCNLGRSSSRKGTATRALLTNEGLTWAALMSGRVPPTASWTGVHITDVYKSPNPIIDLKRSTSRAAAIQTYNRRFKVDAAHDLRYDNVNFDAVRSSVPSPGPPFAKRAGRGLY